MGTSQDLTVRSLDAASWPAYERMMERHNGVFGGCWCTWFHTMSWEKPHDADANRAFKMRLVDEGLAHAALVMDGDEAGAWAQYGTPGELPNIRHRKEYELLVEALPTYRITCMFVDKGYRRRGILEVALRGAVDLIGQSGGGMTEGYPHDTRGNQQSVLYSGTRDLFERVGFSYVCPKGTLNCIMRLDVPASGQVADQMVARSSG